MLFSVLGIQNLLDLELFLVLDPEFYISKMKEQMNKYNLYSYFLTQRKAVCILVRLYCHCTSAYSKQCHINS